MEVIDVFLSQVAELEKTELGGLEFELELVIVTGVLELEEVTTP